MADVDLLFRQAPISQPADLLFGEVEDLPDVDVTLDATLPDLVVDIFCAPPTFVYVDATLPGLVVDIDVTTITDVLVDATLPGLIVEIDAVYMSQTDRPTVGTTVSEWQTGTTAKVSLREKSNAMDKDRSRKENRWQQAIPAPANLRMEQPHNFKRSRAGFEMHHQDAVPVGTRLNAGYANMLRGIRPALDTGFQTGIGLRDSIKTDWQERFRDRRPSLLSAWDETQRLLKAVKDHGGVAKPMWVSRKARYQEAIVPPPGIEALTPVTPPDPCYIPPAGSLVHLLFATSPGNTDLLFLCDRHPVVPATIIVPVRSVYMVINDITLKRVSNNLQLPALSLSISLDVDSWTWGFNASLPATSLDDLQPASGVPVELEASINGHAYRLIVEGLTRERTFGKATIRVTGRGKSALLADPYSPIMTFSNSLDRTAAQLMDDVLTLNGVPIGWDIDWQITDWLVPAGVWNQQGDYITGLNAIAAAAGAYIQPHPTLDQFSVLARYPDAPWNWGDVTPDFELPSSVTTTESIEWKDKALYNRVFVSGVSAGVLGRVTRAGTAGDIVAQMVTDALVTEAAAARQRGLSILADTGRQALVTLKLPVLEETGIIHPGKYVRYVDGSDTRIGIVRSTSVDAGRPEAWQSLLIETHDA